MVRASRQVPLVYLGRPGALVALPFPRSNLDRALTRQVFEFASGTGQYMVSALPAGARQFTVNWSALHVDTFNKVDQFWQAQVGMGPWAWIDPSSPNMLLPNIASATNNLFDTTGFSTSDGLAASGTLVSSTINIQRAVGTRSLRWQFTTAAATTPTLWLGGPYRNWYGYPVAPTLPYTFSCYGRPDGTVDTSITATLALQWFDGSGAQIGSNAAGSSVVLTGGYLPLSVTATAPSGAAYVRPIGLATGSTITTGGSIYLDTFQLEQDTVVNTWAPGSGTRPVEITGLNETVPFDARFRQGVTMTLRELVP
jgi:hypothetical protein